MATDKTTTEQTTTEQVGSVDFDAWLAGLTRQSRTVTLYGRPDLYGALEQARDRVTRLEEQAKTVKATAGDRGLNDNINGDLTAARERRDQLTAELAASAMRFRVEASIEDEVRDAERQARKNLTPEARQALADQAAEIAREDAAAAGHDEETTQEIITAARTTAIVQAIADEVACIILGDRVSTQRGGDWIPVGADAIRKMRKTLGGPQIKMLEETWQTATETTVEVDAPK
ncbi:hypothetical protein [Pseudoglutamicibacter cumminsii]|uniref:hypothetical protein n=1 Tax=Pseudoglutamicibacter cumminsii TaxID=156979 RepID=UPI00195E7BC2|nr:hypothetical protein [Pseudoglutamicibacter cumminsii]MBM7796886.1 hypothetical protein [Pseudoglutamicibacter cumminsii]